MIFVYDYNNGGLGDMIKFFLVSVYLADTYKLDFFIDIKHPIKDFIVINDKFKCNFEYSEYDFLSKEKNLNYMIANNINFIYNTLSYFNNSFDNTKIPNSCYLFNKYNFFHYMNFSPDVYNDIYNLMDNKYKYISIHLRCGDKHIIDSKDFLNDDRINNINYDNIIQKIINDNKINKIYFFCDNNEIKNNYIKKFPELNIISSSIILHVSYDNNDKYSKEMIKNIYRETIIEFLFIHLSNEIHSLTYSGFSLIAHLLKNTKQKFIKYHK